jgi:hypothetical protein
MDDTTILGGALNQLGQTVKQTVKQAVKLPGEMGRSASEQIGTVKPASSAEGSGEPKQWQSDEERIKFLQDLYGAKDKTPVPTSDTKKTSANPLVSSKEKPTEFQEQIKGKSPEEQKKLMELRGQLHNENYYDKIVNPVKEQEERPAEKVENEKKKEMQDLQEKKEKAPPPLAVVREQNKAEMFRGAAG